MNNENIQEKTIHQLILDLSKKEMLISNIPSDQLDELIKITLREVGECVNADRFYIFDYNILNHTCTNTYEWCAQNIEPQIDFLQKVPLVKIPDWINAHFKGEIMYIYDVLSLDYEHRLRQILEFQNIKSLLTVPLMLENQCIGFVGFDSVKNHHEYSEDEVTLLKVFAKLIIKIKNTELKD